MPFMVPEFAWQAYNKATVMNESDPPYRGWGRSNVAPLWLARHAATKARGEMNHRFSVREVTRTARLASGREELKTRGARGTARPGGTGLGVLRTRSVGRADDVVAHSSSLRRCTAIHMLEEWRGVPTRQKTTDGEREVCDKLAGNG